jgi:hypothetical protein
MRVIECFPVRLGHKTSMHNCSWSGGTNTDSTKKHARPHSIFRFVQTVKCQRTIFDSHVGPIWNPQKVLRDTLRRTSVFASMGSMGHVVHSGVICGSRSAFLCVQATKHRHTIFHVHVVRVWFPQKARWDTFRQTCVLTSDGIYGSLGHSGASGAQNIDELFFMLRWDRHGFHQKCPGTRFADLMFLHQV